MWFINYRHLYHFSNQSSQFQETPLARKRATNLKKHTIIFRRYQTKMATVWAFGPYLCIWTHGRVMHELACPLNEVGKHIWARQLWSLWSLANQQTRPCGNCNWKDWLSDWGIAVRLKRKNKITCLSKFFCHLVNNIYSNRWDCQNLEIVCMYNSDRCNSQIVNVHLGTSIKLGRQYLKDILEGKSV